MCATSVKQKQNPDNLTSNGLPLLMGGRLGPKCLWTILTGASKMGSPSQFTGGSGAEVLKFGIYRQASVKDTH